MKKILSVLILSSLILAGCGNSGSSESSSSVPTSENAATAPIAHSHKGGPKLTFRMGEAYDGAVLLTENNVLSASPVSVLDSDGNQQYCISLTLDEEGKNIFYNATSEAAQNGTPISIWYDDELISAPTVATPIEDGKAIISGDFTLDSATELANKICSDSQNDTEHEGEEND